MNAEKMNSRNIYAIISSMYFSLVWVAYSFVNITTDKLFTCLLGLFIFALTYFIAIKVLEVFEQIDVRSINDMSENKKIIVFTVSAILVFAVEIIWLLAYSPGSFSTDSIRQYGQAMNGNYSDWHPVWHTLLFFTFPLKVFKSLMSIIVLQILYFSIIIGYLSLTIYELSSLKFSVIALLYIVLNPYTNYILLYPWKDVAFAMGGLLCTIITIRFAQIQKKTTIWQVFIFSLVCVSTTLFRHNAVLYTAPLMLFLFFYLDKKHYIYTVICFVVMLLCIKGIVYSALDVERPDKRVVECVGLPLTVISNVAKETPNLMDDELSEFVYSIATPEQWQENYNCGDFNSIKWKGITLDVVEEKGCLGTLKLMNKSFLLSPDASFKALFSLTDMVFGFETGLEGNVGASIKENDVGIRYNDDRNQKLLDFTTWYARFINGTIFRYLRTYGICLFVLLLVYLSKLNIGNVASVKKTLIVLPIFIYDFGTMLLLTGPDSRFFYITFLVTPLLIIFAFSNGDVLNE